MPAFMRWRRSRIVDIAKHFASNRLRDGLNAHLRPHPVGVLTAEIVPDTFEARFSAHQAALYLSHRQPPRQLAIDVGHIWRVPRPLDTEAMHEAAQRLIGKHDFTTFRDTECQAKSPEKTLDQLDVVADGDNVNVVTSARSFLHSQVRSMVGSLVWVGRGPLERRRSFERARPRAAAKPAARSRRLTDYIWCGWIIDQSTAHTSRTVTPLTKQMLVTPADMPNVLRRARTIRQRIDGFAVAFAVREVVGVVGDELERAPRQAVTLADCATANSSMIDDVDQFSIVARR